MRLLALLKRIQDLFRSLGRQILLRLCYAYQRHVRKFETPMQPILKILLPQIHSLCFLSTGYNP